MKNKQRLFILLFIFIYIFHFKLIKLLLNYKLFQILKRNFEVFEEEHQKRRREPYTFPTSLCPGLTQNGCYSKLKRILNNFFVPRNIFWPTFSGNGYKLKKIKK